MSRTPRGRSLCPVSHSNYGALLTKLGRHDEAEGHYDLERSRTRRRSLSTQTSLTGVSSFALDKMVKLFGIKINNNSNVHVTDPKLV